jgi:hypothetical protein
MRTDMARGLPTKIGLTFTPGNHTYKLDGKPIPGVTTILGVLDKPAIPKWAAKSVAEYVADNPDTIEVLRDGGRAALVTMLANVPWQKRDKAAARGTELHDWAQQLLDGAEIDVDQVPPELVPVLENAIEFLDTWQIRPLLVEAPVASRTDWWAGTLDLVADYVDPRTGEPGRGVFDWKSGKGLYAEYAWQMCAYGHAEIVGLGGAETPLPEGIAAAFGVHIRADGYDVAPMAYSDEVYQEFVKIRQAYDVVKAGRGDWKVPGSGHVGLMIQTDGTVSVEVAR